MDLKVISALVVVAICLIAVVVLMAIGTIAAEVGVPILAAAAGGALGFLFPSPNQSPPSQ